MNVHMIILYYVNVLEQQSEQRCYKKY